MARPGGTRGASAGGLEEETEDPMFVIKNLDTGTQMRIDDFDRLAHIAADPDPADQETQPLGKKGGLMKGTKALKHWTQAQAKKATATAKKAVSHVKEVAHELNVQQVLSKHKLPFETSPSGRAAAGTDAGQHHGETPRPLFEVLRRSTGESSSALHGDDHQQSGSLASVSVPASSDLSLTSQGSGRQQSIVAAVAAAAGGAGNLGPGAAAAPSTTSGDSLSQAMPSPASTAAAGAQQQHESSLQAPQVAALRSDAPSTPAAATVGPAVPVLVRLVSHKVSRRQYEAVVLAQVLEGSSGVVWAVAVSRDGAFLATAGQDCILRVWQLTASRAKQSRSNWVYSSSHDVQASRSTSLAGVEEGTSRISPTVEQTLPQQQAVQQTDAAAVSPPGQPQKQQPRAGSSEQRDDVCLSQQQQGLLQSQANPLCQQQQQEQQSRLQQQQGPQGQLQQPQHPCQQEAHGQTPPHQQPRQQQPEQPPVVEFGPYFSRTPVRQYLGHTEDILDVSWSNSGGFLLSASLDKTVRLWHLSQPECLRTFEHSDFVTCVQFHPTDAQRFVSGSIDGKIRVWNILDSSVIATAQLHQDMVTAVSFSLNGGRVMAGTMRGRVRFYDLADGKLEYVAQVDVRNQRGQHASGKKVTSIAAVPGQPQQFLITTNDSRLRLLEGYGQVLKYKGHKNSTTQARAVLSPDGSQLACGSDDGCLYLWQRSPSSGTSSGGSAAEPAASGRSGVQQRSGGSGGGGADRARSMAAAAAAQYQHLMSKNASYQAFQAHEPGQPVTAVVFVPPAAAGLPKQSVLCGQAVAPAAGASAAGVQPLPSGAAAAEVAGWDSRRCLVQQLLVSVGFNGSIRVHELLSSQQAGRLRAGS